MFDHRRVLHALIVCGLALSLVGCPQKESSTGTMTTPSPPAAPPSHVTGTARDDNGNPVADMLVYAWLTSDSTEVPPPSDPRVKAQTRSAADGRYTLTLAPEGGQFLVWGYRVLNNRWISDNTVTLDVAAGATATYDVTAQSGYYLRIDQVAPQGPFVRSGGQRIDFKVSWTHWNRKGNPIGRGNMVIGIDETPGIAVRYPLAVIYPDVVQGETSITLNAPAQLGEHTIYAYDSAASNPDQAMINYGDRYTVWKEHHIPVAKLTVE